MRRLHGPHARLEPVEQRQVVGVAAEKRLAEMDVRLDQAGEDVVAFAVDRPVVRFIADTPDGDREVIRSYASPMKEAAGYVVMSGNLFDSAVMKISVIDQDFRARFLSNPDRPNVFEGRAVVFEGPEDYHERIEDPALDIQEQSVLIIRNCGPVGYPGSAEVVNMQPPGELIRKGVLSLPCIGDGRQSGTSGSPSILNATPEAAAAVNAPLRALAAAHSEAFAASRCASGSFFNVSETCEAAPAITSDCSASSLKRAVRPAGSSTSRMSRVWSRRIFTTS